MRYARVAGGTSATAARTCLTMASEAAGPTRYRRMNAEGGRIRKTDDLANTANSVARGATANELHNTSPATR